MIPQKTDPVLQLPANVVYALKLQVQHGRNSAEILGAYPQAPETEMLPKVMQQFSV